MFAIVVYWFLTKEPKLKIAWMINTKDPRYIRFILKRQNSRL